MSGFNERESEDDFLSTMLTLFVAEMELCWNLNYLCVQPQFNQDFGLECIMIDKSLWYLSSNRVFDK